MEYWRVTMAAVPNTSVNHDAPIAAFDSEGLKRKKDPPFRRGMVRQKPVVAFDRFRVAILKKKVRLHLFVMDFHDPDDLDIADLPAPDMFDSHFMLSDIGFRRSTLRRL
jgi:hypothetical protein